MKLQLFGMEELKCTFKHIEERLNSIESTLQEFRYLRKTSFVYENDNMDYLVNYAKSIREENRKLKRELRRSSHDIPKPNKPSWTDKSSPPYSSYQPEKASKKASEKPNSDYQVVLSRKNSIVDLKSETLTKTSPPNVDIEKIVQMEVDAAVGQMHVAMQRDMSKLRARYRTKLHQERQKSKK